MEMTELLPLRVYLFTLSVLELCGKGKERKRCGIHVRQSAVWKHLSPRL